MPERKLAQQDGIHQAEDRRIAADAQREHEHRHPRENRLLEHRAQAITYVLPQISWQMSPPGPQHDRLCGDLSLHSSQLARQPAAFAQLCKRRTRGFRFRRPAGPQLLIPVIEMLRQLLDDLRLARRLQCELRQPLSDLSFPVRHARAW